MRRIMLWCVAGVVVALTMSGCKHTEPIVTPCSGVCYQPLLTPAAPLVNLALAYNNRSQEAVTQYTAMLAPSFVFAYYDPQSANPSLRQYWGTTDDVACTRGLLTDPTVTQLELTLPLTDTLYAIPSAEPGDPAGTRRITINGIALIARRGDILYQIHGSCDFFVAQTDGQWQLIRWVDNTAPPAGAPASAGTIAGQPASWGALKSQFRK